MDKSELIAQELSKTDYQIINKYKLYSKIGNGTFGEVYMGLSTETKSTVAVKIILMDSHGNSYNREIMAYGRLKDGIGIPELAWHGFESETGLLGILVMQMLGPNLKSLLDKYDGKFSLKTVLTLADQMITRIEFLHSNNVIHKDIKPDNFAVGLGSDRDTIYILDFGLSSIYRNTETTKHIQKRSGLGFIGSLKYSSINAQCGKRQSRRDDLESLGYTLITFLKGRLPWANVKSTDAIIKRGQAMRIKSTIPLKELCKDIPEEFLQYMEYCRQLQFKDDPDYEHCRRIFKNLYTSYKFGNECTFDWSEKSE